MGRKRLRQHEPSMVDTMIGSWLLLIGPGLDLLVAVVVSSFCLFVCRCTVGVRRQHAANI